jgi:hypothetical protein
LVTKLELMTIHQCDRLQAKAINIENRRWDPITGTAAAVVGTGRDMVTATTNIFVKPVQAYQSTATRSKSLNTDGHHEWRSTMETSGEQGAAMDNSSIRSAGSSHGSGKKRMGTAVTVAAASASGVGDFFKAYTKGVLVDIPLAAAEGFRAVPKLYGEEVKDHGAINDWISGAKEGGKQFVIGISGGVTGLFTQPIQGAQEGGVLGAAKGLGKGVIGLHTKLASGMFYPCGRCH